MIEARFNIINFNMLKATLVNKTYKKFFQCRYILQRDLVACGNVFKKWKHASIMDVEYPLQFATSCFKEVCT